MRFGGAVAELTTKVAELYKEIVTASVRFENLERNVSDSLARFDDRVTQLEERFASTRDEHVRDRATSAADIRAVDARLTILSEQALHAVARETVRDVMRRTVLLEGSPADDGDDR
jgi:predicted  nucleic acid-binding Zn-ribbon protein